MSEGLALEIQDPEQLACLSRVPREARTNIAQHIKHIR